MMLPEASDIDVQAVVEQGSTVDGLSTVDASCRGEWRQRCWMRPEARRDLYGNELRRCRSNTEATAEKVVWSW